MSVTSYKTMSDFISISHQEILSIYEKKSSEIGVNPKLKIVFELCLNNLSLFPKINLGKNTSIENYISKWINNYYKADINSPSKSTATPKSSCNDPAVKQIVKIATSISDEEANIQEKHHILFMSAENIQGKLLEEYLNHKLNSDTWFWCKGNIVTATDFCKLDGSCLLQIKNKSNTENSSSNKIRKDTKIIKWYRLDSQKINGVITPKFMWSDLNEILNQASPSENYNLNEEDYENFIKNVIKKNKNIISDK